MPADARYCPNCGLAATGAIHVLDLGAPPENERPGPPPPPDRIHSTIAGVLVGAIGLIVALSLIAGGSTDDDASAEDEPSPTVPPATSATTLPAPRIADDLRLITGGDRLDPSLGLAAVWLRSNGAVVVADPATGEEVILVDELPVRPVQAARWTGDMFLVQGVSPGLHVLHPGSGRPWTTITLEDRQVDLFWQTTGALVHLWSSDLRQGVTGGHWGRVLPSGDLEIFEVDAIPTMGRAALVDDRIALETGGAIYLVAPEGAARRHAFGSLLGANDPHLVRRSCDEVLACELVVDNIAAGTQVSMGALAASTPVIVAIPAPDGRAVAMLGPGEAGGAGGTILEVRSPEGDVVNLPLGQWSGDPSSITWTADGSGLFWLDESGPALQFVGWSEGQIQSEPRTVELTPRARYGAGYERLFVVPLDDLPPSWRPSARD